MKRVCTIRLAGSRCFLRMLPLLVGLLGGCRQEMGEQPSYRTMAPCPLFKNDMSARHPPAGTVAQATLQPDPRFYEGMTYPTPENQYMAALVSSGGTARVEPTLEQIERLPYVRQIPMEVDAAVVERGRIRYDIFCSVCHGTDGQGQGIVVEKGFTEASSFYSDRLRQAPAGYFFDIITHGLGPMPNYRHLVPAEDRWTIIGYLRVMQQETAKK